MPRVKSHHAELPLHEEKGSAVSRDTVQSSRIGSHSPKTADENRGALSLYDALGQGRNLGREKDRGHEGSSLNVLKL